MLISSFGLMVLGGKNVQLDGTVKYGFINFLATTLFLLALGLLYGLVGTLNMADVMLRAATVKADPYLVVLPEPIIIQTYRDTPIGKVPSKTPVTRKFWKS